uniref:Uncharacterized protein n=1 Tax=Schistocephalus solidus TaxID=70667 RepID=A0A0X3PY58_SCHSO
MVYAGAVTFNASNALFLSPSPNALALGFMIKSKPEVGSDAGDWRGVSLHLGVPLHLSPLWEFVMGVCHQERLPCSALAVVLVQRVHHASYFRGTRVQTLDGVREHFNLITCLFNQASVIEWPRIGSVICVRLTLSYLSPSTMYRSRNAK